MTSSIEKACTRSFVGTPVWNDAGDTSPLASCQILGLWHPCSWGKRCSERDNRRESGATKVLPHTLSSDSQAPGRVSQGDPCEGGLTWLAAARIASTKLVAPCPSFSTKETAPAANAAGPNPLRMDIATTELPLRLSSLTSS